MANVIKHKRGSGSDPAASNLVIGELAIRTDNGKLFTKMDSGAIAEIAGGGSDIAINTLSSSSATGGGSATFNGSAYRFTLSSPPSVSAQQLLVSINGVVQKPVAGTGQPSEGFSVDGTDIILGDAPAAGSDFFILTFRSLGVSEPADNSVTSAKIVDGAIVNADINASAAIAGSKITPTFTSAISQSDSGGTSNAFATNIQINTTFPSISLNDTDSENDFHIQNQNGLFAIKDTDAAANRLVISSSGNVGIGTSSPGSELHVSALGASDEPTIRLASENSTIFLRTAGSSGSFPTGGGGDDGELTYIGGDFRLGIGTASKNLIFFNGSGYTERMRINSSGQVGMGTSNPVQQAGRGLHINGTDQTRIKLTNASSGATANDGFDIIQENDSEIHIINHENASIKFGTNATERMRIDSAGNVGIGTQSPGAKLQIATAAVDTDVFRIMRQDNTSLPLFSIFQDSSSGGGAGGCHLNTNNRHLMITAKTASSTTDSSGLYLKTTGELGIGTSSPDQKLYVQDTTQHSLIRVIAKNDAEAGIDFGDTDDLDIGRIRYDNNGNHMRFFTNAAERIRIDSSGNVGIGTTSPSETLRVTKGSGNLVKFIRTGTGNSRVLTLQSGRATGGTTANMVAFDNASGSNVGTIRSNVSSTSFNTSSDYRLKENAIAISDGITRLKTLKPYKFNFKIDPNKTVDGFFAHEVSSVVPEAITGTKDEVDENNEPVYQGIDQSKLVPLLVAALQEAIGRIEVLEAK